MMSKSEYRFPTELREIIRDALPEETSLHSIKPELRNTYVPDTHIKALRPDTMLVVGIRGSGKSFWWSALQKPEHRSLLGQQFGIAKDAVISTGFGEKSSPENYPSKDTLCSLLEHNKARLIWRTIVFYHVGKKAIPSDFRILENWKERLEWVRTNPEETEKCLSRADNALAKENKYHLVLFDALDRAADEWQTMNDLVRGLLQNLLEFRSYKKIRLKLFLRTDQLEDSSVMTFPDASKVMSEKAELFWPRHELYGLLWQHLANTENGQLFREKCKELINCKWKKNESVWIVPDMLRREEDEQRNVFHAIAGKWMGKDRRRGFPYTWLINHLGDARREASPRSFLSALRHAASDNLRQDQEYALHYESIKRGVQEASKIRVREMQEDYPWVENLMKPLGGKINVPCDVEEVEKLWKCENILEELKKSIKLASVRLPPAHINEGFRGVILDLAQLGVIEQVAGDRINLPDVYRVGYGIGRRGGVKPVARNRGD
ncbi:MAG: hypothetical protein AB1656_09910 [Candidatus Omnitrophota bacterium]